LDRKSHILPLNPFIDSTGVLRVGGRLTNTKLDYGQKFPILLPSSLHLVGHSVRAYEATSCWVSITLVLFATTLLFVIEWTV